MKILITGGAGFIASHIADAYIKMGHNVAVMDNLSSGRKDFINPKAVFFKVDITDAKGVKSVMDKVKPDILNHHAAQISVRRSVEDPSNDAKINLSGLINLMESGKKYFRKVVFASSGGVVYGEAKKIPTPEIYTPLLPMSPYGVSKLASEYYLNFYRQTYKIPYIALRYSNVYGPRQNPHGEAGVVAIFSLRLLSGQNPIINGSGKQTRDYVYVKDVVNANVKAVQKKVTGSYNIATGKETSVIGIFNGIEKVVMSGKKAKHGPSKSGEQKRSCLNIRLAETELGWSPQTELNAGLTETVEYFRSN